MKPEAKPVVRITILINQKPYHIETDELSAADIRTLAGAPPDYEVWQVLGSPDPEGQLPVNDIQITGTVKVKSGTRFRVVPPGTFGAEPKIPAELLAEVERLKAAGKEAAISLGTDGHYHVVIAQHELAAGYNQKSTSVLIRLPPSYPAGKPDMFWTDWNLRLANGGLPEKATEEAVGGTPYLRFSWHTTAWRPGVDDLSTYVEFVARRLMQAR